MSSTTEEIGPGRIWPEGLPLKDQVKRLADFILALDAGYPNRNAGAMETALEMICDYRAALKAITSDASHADGMRQIASDALAGVFWEEAHDVALD